MPRFVQGDGRDDGDLVLRSPTCLAAREFSAEVGIIHLNLSPQQVGLLPLSHCPQDLVVQHPGRFLFHTQVAAELQRGDPGFGLADQIEGQEPGGQRQFCGLHDRASRERGLMAAGAALITLEAAAVDEPMLMAIAAGTAEPIRPTSLLKGTYCYAEAQELHVAPRCRKATGSLAARCLSGTGCCCAPWPDWYLCTTLGRQGGRGGASWVIKKPFGFSLKKW